MAPLWYPAGPDALVVAAVHLPGRLVVDGGVDVAAALRPVVVEDREVHVAEQGRRQCPRPGEGVPDDDQARGEPAVVDRGEEGAVVVRPAHARAGSLPGALDHLTSGGVVPLVEEAVAPGQVPCLVESRRRERRRLALGDEPQVACRHDCPQVDADVRRRGVGAARRPRAEVVEREVRGGVDVLLEESPGVPGDPGQVGALSARQAAVRRRLSRRSGEEDRGEQRRDGGEGDGKASAHRRLQGHDE